MVPRDKDYQLITLIRRWGESYRWMERNYGTHLFTQKEPNYYKLEAELDGLWSSIYKDYPAEMAKYEAMMRQEFNVDPFNGNQPAVKRYAVNKPAQEVRNEPSVHKQLDLTI